jgi:hypothetical protein
MSVNLRALIARAHGRLARSVLVAALGAGTTIGVMAAPPAEAAIGPVCPVPPGQVGKGIDVCVDRGDNATYQAGDLITVCVSANIPQIMIYPPPPPPTIRVETLPPDGSSRILIDFQAASGEQCATGSIVEPLGQETIRGQALGQDGKVFQEDVVTITTAPR